MNGVLRAFALLFLFCLIGTQAVLADDARPSTAANTTEARLKPSNALLPRVLSARDAALYREIFALGEMGQWDDVDGLVPYLGNDLLIGHVLAQRYLHPTAYTSRPQELAMWLVLYSDLPESGRIRDLIEEKREAERQALLAAKRAAERQRLAKVRAKSDTRTQKTRSGSVKKRDRGRNVTAISNDNPTLALASRDDGIRHQAAGGHAFARNPLGAPSGFLSAAWSGSEAPVRGDWNGALSAWQAGDYDRAAQQFEAVVSRSGDRGWTLAGAAFWAARAHLYARQPEQVNRLLMVAADYPRTFYGLLARRILGLPMPFRWQADEADAAAVSEIAATRTGQRALALIQIGQLGLSEAELEAACCGRRGGAHIHGAMVVAEQAGLAHLAVRLAAELYPNGGGLDAAAYPVPYWRPDGGFTVNPALVYAVARQESKFDPQAVSPAGARGLMQVMPSTADLVGRRSGEWSPGAIRLSDPGVNLAVGQRYLEMLLGQEDIGGDLFRLTAAWNGGPNNVRKWESAGIGTDDPLLYIETIPYGETRDFIERVLANYWIYRSRFGQPAPSLDALAAGAWPTYVEVNEAPARVARSYEN